VIKYWCEICGQEIVGRDIDFRHTADSGEDLHDICCWREGPCSRKEKPDATVRP
jgi:ribosome-binding protein aMBF1 (putative translation factor)